MTVVKQFQDIKKKLLDLGKQQFNGKNSNTQNGKIISINESDFINTELICEICSKKYKNRVNIVSNLLCLSMKC